MCFLLSYLIVSKQIKSVNKKTSGFIYISCPVSDSTLLKKTMKNLYMFIIEDAMYFINLIISTFFLSLFHRLWTLKLPIMWWVNWLLRFLASLQSLQQKIKLLKSCDKSTWITIKYLIHVLHLFSFKTGSIQCLLT